MSTCIRFNDVSSCKRIISGLNPPAPPLAPWTPPLPEIKLDQGATLVAISNLDDEFPVNDGNTRTEFIIYTPEGFRGWSILLEEDNTECKDFDEDLKCTLDTGASTTIEVIVRPPNNAEIKDNYTFTLSVEPTEIGVVGRENIEISVLGQPDEGILGLGLSQEEIASGIYLIVALLFVGLLYRVGKPTISQLFRRKK